ncbi:hypothetical protein LUU34_01517100 [Aix galericulata]|nr:hypothetical protein LUU34_01517100 [Aix galericulata]
MSTTDGFLITTSCSFTERSYRGLQHAEELSRESHFGVKSRRRKEGIGLPAAGIAGVPGQRSSSLVQSSARKDGWTDGRTLP